MNADRAATAAKKVQDTFEGSGLAKRAADLLTDLDELVSAIGRGGIENWLTSLQRIQTRLIRERTRLVDETRPSESREFRYTVAIEAIRNAVTDVAGKQELSDELRWEAVRQHMMTASLALGEATGIAEPGAGGEGPRND